MHDQTFRYGTGQDGADLTAEIPVRRCPDCGFEFLDNEAERIKLEAVCEHLGVLSPGGIQRIRKLHGMTVEELADVTALGTKRLRSWENGEAVQTPAYDRYLRLLEHGNVMTHLRELAERAAQKTRRQTRSTRDG